MKKIMSYILNPIKADKEGAAKMNTKIRKAIGIVGIIMAVYIIFKYILQDIFFKKIYSCFVKNLLKLLQNL